MKCSLYSTKPQEIYTNLYETNSADSINTVLELQNIPIKFNQENGIESLSLGKYVVTIDEMGYCFHTIVNTQNYYLILVPEYIVGYDICFIYNKENSLMYMTDIYNLDNKPYEIQYETCNFEDLSISVLYQKSHSKEKIHFSKCISNIIRL